MRGSASSTPKISEPTLVEIFLSAEKDCPRASRARPTNDHSSRMFAVNQRGEIVPSTYCKVVCKIAAAKIKNVILNMRGTVLEN